jgi:hypothetical protein
MILLSEFIFLEEQQQQSLLEKLKTVHSIEETLKIIKENKLEVLSEQGSTRVVYKLNEEFVLKIPVYSSYIRFNLEEINNFPCLTKRFAAEITEFHPKGYWLVMEFVKPFERDNPEEFNKKVEQILGFPVNDRTGEVLVQAVVENRYSPDTKLKKQLCKTSEWFRELTTKLSSCKVGGQDLSWFNWGLRESTGELVMLDYAEQIKDPILQQPCSSSQ